MPSRRLFWGGLGLAGVLAGTIAAAPTGLLNALAAVGSRQRLQGQPYGPRARQRYDLYAPDAPAAAPLVVFFYGGAWNRGRREDYRFVGEALAERGLMAMVADYRLHPEVRYPDFLHDCAAAVAHALDSARRWGADPSRVVLAGHSAGAYNAAMLALDERWLGAAGVRRRQLAGWVGLAGPYDFLPIRTPEVQAAFGHPNVPPDSQPIVHAGASILPSLLAAPMIDQRVDPQRNTAALADALRRSGSVVLERRYERVGHESLVGAFGRPLRGLAPVLDEMTDFVHACPGSGRRA